MRSSLADHAIRTSPVESFSRTRPWWRRSDRLELARTAGGSCCRQRSPCRRWIRTRSSVSSRGRAERARHRPRAGAGERDHPHRARPAVARCPTRASFAFASSDIQSVVHGSANTQYGPRPIRRRERASVADDLCLHHVHRRAPRIRRRHLDDDTVLADVHLAHDPELDDAEHRHLGILHLFEPGAASARG